MSEAQAIILGSGVAGLSGAIYLGRYGYQPLVLTGDVYGGKSTWTDKIDNYPGFDQGVTGVDLSQKMMRQAESVGARLEMEQVSQVDLSQRPFKIWTESSTDKEPDYLASVLIIATGSRPVMLGLPEEESYLGRGLAFCATCDGPFYQDKTVVVVGGGNTAVHEAYLLSTYAKKVILIHRRAKWRADKILVQKLESIKNLEMMLESEIVSLQGDKFLSAIKVKNLVNQEEKIIKTDGLFLALGNAPETEFLQSQLALTPGGYIKRMIAINQNSPQTATSVAGVFVAGDVTDERYKQIAVAAGQGVMAGIDAVNFLEQL